MQPAKFQRGTELIPDEVINYGMMSATQSKGRRHRDAGALFPSHAKGLVREQSQRPPRGREEGSVFQALIFCVINSLALLAD